LAKTIQDKIDELNSISAIAVTNYPFPNVFDINENLPLGWQPKDWEENCALKISGVTIAHEMRVLSPDEYTIEGDVDYTMEGDHKLTVRLLNERVGPITTEFSIKIINLTPDYYSIEPYGYQDEKSGGEAVPFPSKAKAGETVNVMLNPKQGYIFEKGTLTFSRYPSGNTEKIDENVRAFKMPAYPVKLHAGFAKAEAMRAGSGGYIYYRKLADALDDTVNSGPVIVVSDVSAASEIQVTSEIKITTQNGASKSITRDSVTGNIFNVKTGGSLTLEAGSAGVLVISGGNIRTGSALIVVNGGTLTLNNGVILKENKNTVNVSGTPSGHGGAVSVEGGDFVMNGGIITGNEAGSGGGIYNNGSFTMNGGEIASNTTASGGNGGGVYNGASFTMNGGAVITQNNDVYLPDDMRITVGTLTPAFGAYSAKITPATYPAIGASPRYVLNILVGTAGDSHTKITVTPGPDSLWSIDDDGVLYQSGSSVSSSQGLKDALDWVKTAKAGGQFSNGMEVVILLKSSIDFPSTSAPASSDYSRIHISGADNYPPLLFKADTPVTLNAARDRVLSISDGNTVTIGSNVTLTGGNLSAYGGAGAKVSGTGSKLILDGGIITENKAPNAAGVEVSGGATFIMKSGEISHNSCTSTGGGVQVKDNSAFEMSGGSIHNNKAGSGGGVAVTNGGSFDMVSPAVKANVHDNTSNNVWGDTSGRFSVNGALQGNSGGIYY
jgi:hypothetical protein